MSNDVPEAEYLCSVGILTIHTWHLIQEKTCPAPLFIRVRCVFAGVLWQDNYHSRDKSRLGVKVGGLWKLRPVMIQEMSIPLLLHPISDSKYINGKELKQH
jgi:hypothetical protein